MSRLTTITVYADTTTADALAEWADAHDVSVSEAGRTAINQLLQNGTEDPDNGD